MNSPLSPASVTRLVSIPLRDHEQLSYALGMPNLPLAKCDELLDAMLALGGPHEAAHVIRHRLWSKASSPRRYLTAYLELLLEDDTIESLLAVVRHLEPTDDPADYRRQAVGVIAKVHSSAIAALKQPVRLRRSEAQRLIRSALLVKPMTGRRAKILLAANERFEHDLLDEGDWLRMLAYADEAANQDVYRLLAFGRQEYAFGARNACACRPLNISERHQLLSQIVTYYNSVAHYLLARKWRANSETSPKLIRREIRMLAGPAIEYLEEYAGKHPHEVQGAQMTRDLMESRAWKYFTPEEQKRVNDLIGYYFDKAGLSEFGR